MVCIVTFSVKQRGCPGGLVGAPCIRRAMDFEVGVPGKSGERLKYGRGILGFKGTFVQTAWPEIVQSTPSPFDGGGIKGGRGRVRGVCGWIPPSCSITDL